ncbi:MAG: serine/threonine-protein kinase [Myxococcota bacterium]|nr:serine/threonine-protein kinase [Myxococcota bacterium]
MVGSPDPDASVLGTLQSLERRTATMNTDGSRDGLELTLLQERSAGTFAQVYLAEARSRGGIDRIVAVKLLKDQWSEHDEMMVRTRDEARLLARLHHRNILRVEAMTQLNGRPAIVMEFVDGLNLAQLLEQLTTHGRRFPPRAAYSVAADAASALHAAYSRAPVGQDAPLEVVHRDLKPSNIMLSIEGDVKVLDFGTARFASDARVARTGLMRFGSMKYMSPERRLGDRGDHSSDVYALGLVLLELLLGRDVAMLPLDSGEHEAALEAALAALPDLGLPNEDWSQSLRQTLRCMCAPEPENRLDAGQALDLLRAFADHAAGAPLDGFARKTVGPLTRAVYGEGRDGDLSGARILVGLESTGGARGQAPQPASGTGAADTRPMARAGLLAAAKEHAPATAYRPGAPALPDPDPSSGPASPSPTSIGHDRRKAILIGALAGLMCAGVLGLGALGGLTWWLWRNTPGPAPAAEASVDASASGHAIVLTSSDETVRWMKIEDAAGSTVLTGRPDATGSVESGQYTLRAKVVGRSTASAPLVVSGPVHLRCMPRSKARVRCEAEDGTAIDLEP